MWQQKHCCSLLLGHVQMLPPDIQHPSALLFVSTTQKIREELEKRTAMEPCAER